MYKTFIILGALFLFVISTIFAFLCILALSAFIYGMRPMFFEKLMYEDYQAHIIKPRAKAIMNFIIFVLPIILGFICTINYYIN